MAGILGYCSLAAGSAPFGCDWCGKQLTGRKERWCGPLCVAAYRKNHIWTYARPAAIRRDGNKCVRCGGHDGLEVNHIVPLGGSVDFDGKRGRDKRGRESCLHHLDGLETLCHDCHVGVTRQQRADGLI